MSGTIEALTTRTLALSTESPAEQVVNLILARDAAKERLREACAGVDAFLKEWLEANGELELGDKRFFVGTETKKKDRDVARTYQCLRELSKPVELVGLLSTSAFKPGAVEKFLAEKGVPDMFGELFDVTVETDLKTGKPLKKVREVNQRFLK